MPVSLLEARDINVHDLVIKPNTSEKNPIVQFVSEEKIKKLEELTNDSNWNILDRSRCAGALILLGRLHHGQLPKSIIEKLLPTVIELSDTVIDDTRNGEYRSSGMLGEYLIYFKLLYPLEFKSYREGFSANTDYSCLKLYVNDPDTGGPLYKLFPIGFAFPDLFKGDKIWKGKLRKKFQDYIYGQPDGSRTASVCRIVFPEENNLELKTIYKGLAATETMELSRDKDKVDITYHAEAVLAASILLADSVKVTEDELILEYDNLEEVKLRPIPERRKY